MEVLEYRSGQYERKLLLDEGTCTTSHAPEAKPLAPRRNFLGAALRSLLLPEGYPHTVTEDYLEFQIWDTLQAVCSYLRGILCTQAVLTGVGVGDSAKTAASATVQWVLRDGLGMFGGMLFAWSQSRRFGYDVKQVPPPQQCHLHCLVRPSTTWGGGLLCLMIREPTRMEFIVFT